jgi:hypothetical protein
MRPLFPIVREVTLRADSIWFERIRPPSVALRPNDPKDTVIPRVSGVTFDMSVRPLCHFLNFTFLGINIKIICYFFQQEKLRKEMGLKIDILALDHKAYLEHTASKKSPLFLRSWSADYPAIENFLGVFRSLSGNNRTGWKNSEYDRLLERGRFAEAEKLLLDQAVVVPLYYEPNLFMIQNQVRGFHPNPLNIVDLRKVELSQ